MNSPQQPYLHDLVPLLSGPAQVWCSQSGDVADSGLGVIVSDTQVLGRLALRLDGQTVTWLGRRLTGLTATWTGVVRHLQDESVDGADPRIVITRSRTLSCDPTRSVIEEEVIISSALDRTVQTMVDLEFGPSLEPIDQVKAGRCALIQANAMEEGFVSWGDANVAARLAIETGERLAGEDRAVKIRNQLTLGPAETRHLHWRLEVTSSPDTPVVAARTTADEAPTALLPAAGTRLREWLDQSLTDLASLRLEHRAAPGQAFYGAGAPWYLTLFGRDSLWAARLARALDPGTAAATLTVLGALQGQRVDPETEEAPGKILHEIRGTGFTALPTRYYGTIDATALWVNLLCDLVDDDLISDADLRSHQSTLERALGWISGRHADPDGDGFLEYRSPIGRGLANQGWKDSPDAVRFADGRIATGPIALCEVQGYAYAACSRGAALLEQLGVDAAPSRHWAERLRDRFQQHFCDADRLPAFALDGAKHRVDATTSNIGHLLGTGILDHDQERAVAERLCQPDMTSGLGLRTMSSDDGGYHPLSYHCGSVWAHDTAIVIDGMLRAELNDNGAFLANQMLAAANHFHNRLPELWSGDSAGTPYPAACHPQAWAAAAAIPAVHALTHRASNVAKRR